MAISGKSEKEIWAFIDQVAQVMLRGVETGLTKENVEYFYSVLRMGNPEKDLEVMKAVW